MKYIFVCPEVFSLTTQYRDFASEENCSLVTIGGIKRKFSKALSILGITKIKVFDFIFTPVFKKVFQNIANKDDELCFILYSRTLEDFCGSIYRYLKNTYRNCLVVVYYGDLVSRHYMNIDTVRKNTDAIFSFDENDAKQYNINWLLEPFSGSVINMPELNEGKNEFKWDVTFVGHAKNRYSKIISIYEKFKKAGLKCDFHIVGVPKEKRVHEEEISYEPLPFLDLLKHVLSSRCILEIMQDDAFSPTTRYAEAVLFGRNLLTDCVAFNNDNRPKNIYYFNNLDDIDESCINNLLHFCMYDRNKYIEMFSVKRMIECIEDDLKKGVLK